MKFIPLMLLPLIIMSSSLNAKENATFLRDLGPIPHWVQVSDTANILNLYIGGGNLDYDAFRDAFNLSNRARVDLVFKTRVRYDAVRYRVIGKNYNADELLNCVVWEITHHTPDKNDPLYIESRASKVYKDDCIKFFKPNN